MKKNTSFFLFKNSDHGSQMPKKALKQIAKKRWDILFGGKGVFENKFLKNYGGKI